MQGHVTAHFIYILQFAKRFLVQWICILPINDEAPATVQNFNIFVSEAPVDAEMVMPRGRHSRTHVVAAEKEDVVFFVGCRQKIIQSITQSLVGDVRHFLIKELLAP